MSHRLYGTTYYEPETHERISIVCEGLATVNEVCKQGIKGAPNMPLLWTRGNELPRPRHGRRWKYFELVSLDTGVPHPKAWCFREVWKKRRNR